MESFSNGKHSPQSKSYCSGKESECFALRFKIAYITYCLSKRFEEAMDGDAETQRKRDEKNKQKEADPLAVSSRDINIYVVTSHFNFQNGGVTRTLVSYNNAVAAGSEVTQEAILYRLF